MSNLLKRYEVHHYMLCGGWDNVWNVEEDGKTYPLTFSSIKWAQDEIDELIQENLGYEYDEFRIYDRENKEYVR